MRNILLVGLAFALGATSDSAGSWPWLLQAIRYGACFFTGYLAAEYGAQLAKLRKAEKPR